ncbi:hypothetical protein COT42_06670 [Candidatus Saganbacteria bacterium CG08_land_8_20_14_0_20_45_16]|uniref:Helix-turn-helix domain-containing protein n=1 Tax=Candidatus Saganbacteria bacterium CG08_land_8_20_14_0_20_45_16 TaxID=2014293 RepID=A0A2H0XVE5_UNCSA|nr:MAG: hypothetical protein COT42_06670 [Candidatus Saganbacteria bacterium CG08_land_8_20_14_0_20_45_16]
MVNETEIYTADETQKLLKISDSTFRRLIKKGILRAGKIGGQYRVLGREILRILSPELPGKLRHTYHKIVDNF